MTQDFTDSRYDLVCLLGTGGMARVYLAHDGTLNRDVALKILREQYADDEEFVERFRREAQNAGCLSHPNIVSTFDWGRSKDGSYYITMEYLPGGTLKRRILRDGAFSPGEATRLALQIAGALEAAHERGVIHRDVKPHNILFTAAGNAKVVDFGIARAASSSALSGTSMILGTAGYMSPEQALGETVGPRSDLYSLGVVLYEMLTGTLPYEAETPIGVALKHVNEPPRPPKETNPEVPEGLNIVTAKLLAKYPEDRYEDVSELMRDLERVRAGFPPLATLPAAAEMTTALPRVHRGAPGTALRSNARRRRKVAGFSTAMLTSALLLGGVALALSDNLPILDYIEKADKAGKATGAGEEASAVMEDTPSEGAADEQTDDDSETGETREETTETGETAQEATPPVVQSVAQSAPAAPPVAESNLMAVQTPAVTGATPAPAAPPSAEAPSAEAPSAEAPSAEAPSAEAPAPAAPPATTSPTPPAPEEKTASREAPQPPAPSKAEPASPQRTVPEQPAAPQQAAPAAPALEQPAAPPERTVAPQPVREEPEETRERSGGGTTDPGLVDFGPDGPVESDRDRSEKD